MLASHDSLTGYPLKTWWYKPFEFMAKCQDKDIESQLKAGVRYFDLRFNFHNNRLYGQHGFMVYDITISKVLEIFNNWTFINKENIYYRIILEDTLDKNIEFDHFLKLVKIKLKLYSNKYMHVHWIGQKSKWGQAPGYNDIPFYGKNNFTNDCKGISEKIEEMEKIEPREDLSVYECYTYKGIPKLFNLPFPRLAAWRINKHIKSSKNFTMQDFV